MAEEKKQRGTTVWIDQDTLVALEGYCGKYKVTKKDFVKYAVEWFQHNDVDIVSETSYGHQKDADEQLKRDQKQLPAVKDQIEKLVSMVNNIPDVKSMINEMPQKLALAIQQHSVDLASHEDMEAQAAKLDKLLTDRRELKDDIVKFMNESLRFRARLEEAVRELERCRGMFSKPNEQVIKAIKKELQQ